MKKLKINKKMLKNHIEYDECYVSELEKESIFLLDKISNTEEHLQDVYMNLDIEDDSFNGNEEEYTEKEVLKYCNSYERASKNIIKSYIKIVGMYDELSARWKDLQRIKKDRLLPTAPANSIIDIKENNLNHFAKGMNMYKIMLLCFMGSFFGVIVELIWCLLRYGYIESRSGLVYGPFNLLYGAGAVFLSLALYRFRNNGAWLSFIGGFVVGSVLEYICSWGQETLLGSRSWDYSMMPFNLNGRICLLYSFFWGFLGVLWMKTVYPWMAELILKMPNKSGKIATWAVTIFLIINSVVSLVAVYRWSERVDLVPADNSFWEFIDTRFPNERMERIFANMVFD